MQASIQSCMVEALVIEISLFRRPLVPVKAPKSSLQRYWYVALPEPTVELY